MFIVKVHPAANSKILVISDSEIVGRKFEEGKLQLDLTKSFYQGEKTPPEKIKELLKGANILHLTGPQTIKFFERLGFIEKGKVLFIAKIPHAEVYLEEN